MIEGDSFTPIAYSLLFISHIMDTYIHISPLLMTFLSTCLIVYIGCVKSSKIFTEEQKEEIEAMKQKDAWMFPVTGSAILFGLFIIFKYLNKDYINILFHCYFTVIGAYSISALINEKICQYSFFKKYAEKKIFTVPVIPFLVEKETTVFQLDIITFCMGSVVGLFYFFLKNWQLNNVLGCSFSIFGIENMLLGEYKIGLILLSLLFFYDIFWVFFTEVMVSVAKNLDGPIKLKFPKFLNPIENKDFNMIGLGDIVVPGVYIALMLRFDIVQFIRKNGSVNNLKMNYQNFKYFFHTFFGYCLGIIVTLGIMVLFNHAQPALLYLVPGVLISSTGTSIFKGEFKALWNFNEEKVQKEEFNKDKKENEENDGNKDKKE